MTHFTYLSFKDVVTIGERGAHDEYAEIGNVIDAESARKLTARLNTLYTTLSDLLCRVEGECASVVPLDDPQNPFCKEILAARKALGRA